MNITYAHLNAYINGTLSNELEDIVLEAIEQDPSLMDQIESKKSEKTLVRALIPNYRSSHQLQTEIFEDLKLVNDEIIQVDKSNVLNMIAKFLDTPVIEF